MSLLCVECSVPVHVECNVSVICGVQCVPVVYGVQCVPVVCGVQCVPHVYV